MKIVSYGGFDFAANDYDGGFPDSGLRGQWTPRTLVLPVTGAVAHCRADTDGGARP